MLGKRGVSLMVSYVLLIVITISLSIIIFTWLRFFAGGEVEPKSCPTGVSLVIDSYNCTLSGEDESNINVTLKNKGRFIISNFTIRANNRANAEFGISELKAPDPAITPIAPNEKKTFTYKLAEAVPPLADIKLLDVQPLFTVEGETILCNSFSTQEITCTSG